jgi:tRNA-(ms[2]io[6]A)-hydroxylase
MLGLLQPTDPTWVEAAETDLDGLLSDHAHCELKAAQSALSLLGRYGGEVPALVDPLTALVHEETDHFGQVRARIAQRESRLGPPRSDEYVTKLRAASRADRHADTPALLDRLLVAALIEGRSCERFRLLASQLRAAELRTFYADLMASEARHFTLFTSLAAECFGDQASRSRFATLAAREAAIAAQLPLGPTVHG